MLQPSLADFGRRGFRITSGPARVTLEAAARAFLTGFNNELGTAPAIAPDLAVPEHHHGFAAEGVAMAAALLDLMNPAGGRRLDAVHRAHDDRHAYLLHVGAGWALAKLRRRAPAWLGAHAPLLRWLAYDGTGFCQGFFANERALRRWSAHPGRCSAICEIRHQGYGRSLWFRDCADPAGVAAHIAALPPHHHGDAWSGAGLAATYAGGASPDDLERLREHAGRHGAALAQGAAFAAEARRLSGHVPAHTDTAAGVLAGATVTRAAEWTWQAREGLDRRGAGVAQYLQWRQRIQRLAVTAGARS
jgi:hypothetical protein